MGRDHPRYLLLSKVICFPAPTQEAFFAKGAGLAKKPLTRKICQLLSGSVFEVWGTIKSPTNKQAQKQAP